MIILDTDAISALMLPAPAQTLLAQLGAIPLTEHATTTITLGELSYGAIKADRPELYARATGLLTGVTILGFDRAAAEIYGRVRVTLERAGRPLADPDLRIAAIALANRAVLVTGKVRHFARVADLRIEDWLHA